MSNKFAARRKRTIEWANKFRKAHDNFDEQSQLDAGLSPKIIKAQKDAMKSQEMDLRNQARLTDFEMEWPYLVWKNEVVWEQRWQTRGKMTAKDMDWKAWRDYWNDEYSPHDAVEMDISYAN